MPTDDELKSAMLTLMVYAQTREKQTFVVISRHEDAPFMLIGSAAPEMIRQLKRDNVLLCNELNTQVNRVVEVDPVEMANKVFPPPFPCGP